MSARSKTQERRVARYFGVERTPLSGGASRHTRSDTLHPDLFIEVKSAIGPGGTNGWLFRMVREVEPWPDENLHFAVDEVYLVHNSTIEPEARYYTTIALSIKAACLRLWKQTQELAAQEKKVPLLALLVKGRRGFWLVGDADSILAAQKARKETVEHGNIVDEG